MTEQSVGPTPAQVRYRDAMIAANETAQLLNEQGRTDRLAGLAVGVDLCTSAAFLFSLTDQDYDNAATSVRASIAHALADEGL
jgi:hypothetical protein